MYVYIYTRTYAARHMYCAFIRLMYVHMCWCMCICVCAHIFSCMCMCMFMYILYVLCIIYVCMHMQCVWIRFFRGISPHICWKSLQSDFEVCICICMCVYTHIPTYPHTHIHTRTHAHSWIICCIFLTYTHTHTYMHMDTAHRQSLLYTLSYKPGEESQGHAAQRTKSFQRSKKKWSNIPFLAGVMSVLLA